MLCCNIPGHVAPLPLPRAVGRQPLRVGRAAMSHVSVVSHVRPLYQICVYTRARLLRSLGRLPRSVPSCGKRTRLRRRQPSIRLLGGSHSRSDGESDHGTRCHQKSHVFRLIKHHPFPQALVQFDRVYMPLKSLYRLR